jgi:hypothetical protein
MAVDRETQIRDSLGRDDEGQSVLEFLLILPLLIAVLTLIIRTNTVIQMSIVDQKYARAQTLTIAGNAAEYPLRAGIVSYLGKNGMNQLIVGVSEHHLESGSDGGGGQSATASTYYIGRRPAMQEDTEAGEVDHRLTIRVRNTVTLCLPTISVGGKPAFDFNPNGPSGGTYNYPEDPKAWQFCSSSREQNS